MEKPFLPCAMLVPDIGLSEKEGVVERPPVSTMVGVSQNACFYHV